MLPSTSASVAHGVAVQSNVKKIKLIHTAVDAHPCLIASPVDTSLVQTAAAVVLHIGPMHSSTPVAMPSIVPHPAPVVQKRPLSELFIVPGETDRQLQTGETTRIEGFMNARWQDIVDMSDEQLAVEKAALEAEIGSGFQAKVTAEQAEAKGVATGHEASTPRRQARDATQVRRKVYVNELYCFCQQPFNRSALMVACEGCKEQFHATCLGLSRVEASVVAQFICPTCNSNKPFGSMAFKREKLLKQEISTFDELTTVDELEAVLESLIRSGERGQKLREEDLARYNEYLDAQQELVMTVAKPSTNSVSHGNSWAKNNRIHRHQRRAEHSLEKQSTKRRIAFQVDTRNLPVKKSDSDIDPDLVRRVKSHMALYGITQQMVSDCIGLSGGRSGLSNWLNTKRVPNLAAKECQLREWLRLEEDKVRAGLLTPVSPDMIGANKNKKRKASKLAH